MPQAKFTATHTVHKIPFKREGTCNRCGICCVDDQCSHYQVVDSVPTCLIYNERHKVCAEHSAESGRDIDHSVCIRFPDHSWLKVIKETECSYTFDRLDESGNVSLEPLPFGAK